MPTLAEPLAFNAPTPAFLRYVGSISKPCATLLWAGLTPDTRKAYNAAIGSYETFCALGGIQVQWSAKEYTLGELITGRLFGSTSTKQGQIKPKTVEVYLAWLQRIVKGGHRLFPGIKRQRLPITKDTLNRFTANVPSTADELNYDAAFKTAWAGFLRVGEFTHTQQALKRPSFVQTGLIRPASKSCSPPPTIQRARLKLFAGCSIETRSPPMHHCSAYTKAPLHGTSAKAPLNMLPTTACLIKKLKR